MTKRKSTDAAENIEAADKTENVSVSDTVEAETKPAQVNIPKKYIYLGASLPNNALKSNTVFDGTFEEVCKYLQAEIKQYPLVKELLIPVDRLSASGTSSRISGLKKELLKSFERRI